MKLFLTALQWLWRAVVRVLDFLNMLEPSKDPVLSITKVTQWAGLIMMTAIVWKLVTSGLDDQSGIGAAIAGAVFTGGTAAGVVRRHYQYKSGKGPYDDLKGTARVDNPDA